jgi:hypothetical protein
MDSDEDDESYCPSVGEHSESSSLLLEDFSHEDDIGEDEDYEEESEEFSSGNQWKEIKFNGTINLHFDSIDAEFEKKLQQQATYIKEKLNEKKTFHKEDLKRMTDSVLLFNSFASPEIFFHLKDSMNKNRPPSAPDIEMREVELMVRLIFALSVYETSFERCCALPRIYPLVASIVAKFEGCADRANLVLRATDFYRNHLQNYGDIWDAPFQANPILQKLEQQVTHSCAEIAFKTGVSDFIVDDDKMRNRSSKSAKLGWIRSKGLKSFGPVNNFLGELPSGLFLGSAMTRQGDSGLDATERVFRRISNVEEDSEVDLSGSTLGGDRGYEDEQFQNGYAPEKTWILFAPQNEVLPAVS